jgi:predicted dehydrogenase
MRRSIRMRLKIGVVGLNHGYSLARAIRSSNTLELAGLCTRNPASHQRQAAELGVPLFADLDSMLAELDLDGAVLAAATNQLVTLAKRCLEHNVSILIEKPAGIDVSEVLALKPVAARTTARVIVGYYRRLARQVLALKELLAANVIGDVVGVSCKWVIKKPPGYFQGWKSSRASGGGCLMINVIHDLDLLQNLFGPVDTVAALESPSGKPDDLEHCVALNMRFSNGTLGSVFLCDQSPSPYSYENTVAAVSKFPTYRVDSHHFFGTNGSLAFPSFTLYSSRSPSHSWLDTLDSRVVSDANDTIDDPIALQMERFSQVLRGEREPHATLDDAIRNLAVVEAIRRSIARSTPESIQYPLDNSDLFN